MVILNANYTPTKRKVQIYFPGAPAPDSLVEFCSVFKIGRVQKRLCSSHALLNQFIHSLSAGAAEASQSYVLTCLFHIAVGTTRAGQHPSAAPGIEMSITYSYHSPLQPQTL